MSKEPDFDRLSEISRRLEEAQTQPDYPETFHKAVAEAEEACGEHRQFMEFLAPFAPAKNGKPAIGQRRAN